MNPEAADALLKRLYLYWLRPERALFCAYVELHAPLIPWGLSIELGCGDGLETFLRLGGIPDPAFDYYAALEGKVSAEEYFGGKDVYDVPVRSFAAVKEKPPLRFHEGLDLKGHLLDRARLLETYDALKQHDLNTALPYKDGSVDFVYSDVLYWLNDPEAVILEVGRVLDQRGAAVFEVLTSAIRAEDFSHRFGGWGPDWCRLMDRGRSISYPGLQSLHQWEAAFNKAGLRVKKVINILPRGIFLVWNVGLRPLYPLLKRFVDGVPLSERQAIREEWVQTFYTLLYPVLVKPEVLAYDSEPLRVQFVLEK